MNAHEKSLLAGAGGLPSPAAIPAEIEQSIKANTQLFNSMKIESVPFVMAKNGRTGQVVTHNGSMATKALAELIGLPD
jgi:thiol:disulfide interchange protein DsbG